MTLIQDDAEPKPLPALPPLHALRAFHAAASLPRFRDAAQALGLTESAISHQVKKLEGYLGVPLFVRSGGRPVLSPAGQRFFDLIDPALTQIRAATEEVTRRSNRVSVTLPKSLATSWLIPRLGLLERDHPELDVRMVATGRVCDLKREQIDLGIRHGRGDWPGLCAEHLYEVIAFPVCAPGFVTPCQGDPTAVLSGHRLISAFPDEWAEWCAARGLPAPDPSQIRGFDSHWDAYEAATAGLCLALGHRPQVDRYLEDGHLTAPFGEDYKSGANYFLVWPEQVEMRAAVRRVARWISHHASTFTAPEQNLAPSRTTRSY